MTLDVIGAVDRDDWDATEYTNYGVMAEVAHHTDNGRDGGPNRHAVIMGETVILVEGETR